MWTTPTRLFQKVPAPKIITWHHIAIFEVWSLPPAHTFFDHHTCALIHLSGIVFANGYWVTSFQDLGTINVCSSMVFLMCELSILLEVSQATSRHQPNEHRQRQQPNTNQLATGCWCSSMISTISGTQRWTAHLKAGAWLTTVEDLFRRLKTTAAASTSESDLRFRISYPQQFRVSPYRR